MAARYLKAVREAELIAKSGRLCQALGLVLMADGVDAALGELCEIRGRRRRYSTRAEVVGIKEGRLLLVPYGDTQGISLNSEVIATGRWAEMPVTPRLLGRVIDAFGKPLDDGPPLTAEASYPLHRDPPNPMQRPPIRNVLETGVRAVDALLTVGRGQRMGIFAGSGVGKSTFLGMVCRHMNADVNVIAMVGERGREVVDFIQNVLGKDGLARSVVVVATSDQPAIARTRAAYAATAVAEYFRDRGQDVVLTMDSVTRFAMAQRELGLAAGEPPTSRGYTPSVFTALPRLLERCGTAPTGSITAFYTVLVEGDDLNEPVADHVRAILDGSIVLARSLANRRHFPAIDLLHSNSRLIGSLASGDEQALADGMVRLLDTYERSRDLIDMGAYKAGSNAELDRALAHMPAIDGFLQQGSAEPSSRAAALKMLADAMRQPRGTRP